MLLLSIIQIFLAFFSELFFKFSFDLVDKDVGVFVVYFQFVDYYVFCSFCPLSEFPVRDEAFREVEKQAEVETVGGYARPAFHGVECIAFLFDVGRHHQDWFLEVHGLADGFEPCGACVCLAACHLP